jgi:histidine phosphotransfer protein HptB
MTLMSESIIDLAIYNDLKLNLGDDFIDELVETYCVETPQLINQLQQALGSNDADTFRRAAHSIKSSSASIGAMQFSAQAKELEAIGKSGDLSGASALVASLVEAYGRVDQALQDLKNGS